MTTTTFHLDELRGKQQAVWSSGDYNKIAAARQGAKATGIDYGRRVPPRRWEEVELSLPADHHLATQRHEDRVLRTSLRRLRERGGGTEQLARPWSWQLDETARGVADLQWPEEPEARSHL